MAGCPQLHPFSGLGYLRVGPGGLDEAHAFVDADEAQAEEAEASPAADAPGGKGVGFGDGGLRGLYIYIYIITCIIFNNVIHTHIYIYTNYVSVIHICIYIYVYIHIISQMLYFVHLLYIHLGMFFLGRAGVKWREGRSIKPNFQLDNLDIFFWK